MLMIPAPVLPAAAIETLQRLQQRYQQQSTSSPVPASRPLRIAGRLCGWLDPAAQAALADNPVCAHHDDGLELFHDIPPGPALDAALAALALKLRDAGCLRTWRDETLPVTDASGQVFAALERGAVRPFGLLTFALHLNAWTPEGNLWIAQRALTKSTDPGMWDTLVGGLAAYGESMETALLRESAEEAGLEPADLNSRSPLRTIWRVRSRLPEGYQLEDIIVSDCILSPDVRPANQDGEVMTIRTASPLEVTAMLEAGDFTQEAALVLIEGLLHYSQAT